MRAVLLTTLILSTLSAVRLEAAVKTQEVTYEHGGTKLQGFVAWDDAVTGKRPGVLVVHEWWGHNDHARNQAKRLAEAGYVGFALDMYGDGKVAAHPPDAQKFVAEALSQPEVMKARFLAARAMLASNPHVDAEKTAAIGYCFGGAVVLGMAREGMDLDLVASFHGSLGTAKKAAPGSIQSRVLVLHGGADSMVTPAQVDAFRQEMTDAGAKFEIMVLENAKHSFTNPDADAHGMPALGYDAEADRASWQRLVEVLGEVFPR
ncbi:MAG TPA: dienelactone hydrolase family protein [Thermoanaerobaculia bacterium]|nr:dienelactone hydrolase family protein [Thermoanaerobaculia bacterium]